MKTFSSAREAWRAAYRAARIAVPASERAALFPSHLRGWDETSARGKAERALYEACSQALGESDEDRAPFRGGWYMIDRAREALRPVQSVAQKTGTNVLNGFGMFSRYPGTVADYYKDWPNNRPCKWMALDARRRKMIAAMRARGVVACDQGNHIRAWTLQQGIMA